LRCSAIHSYISINGDKYFRNNSHCNYWHHWHNSYSDHWNNGKYHRAIHSYIAINGVPVVSVAIVPAVLFTVDCDVAVDGSVVLSVVPVV
jgi:hypothetical protein